MKKTFLAALILISTSLFGQELKTKFNWHNLDYTADGVRGISTEKAYKELLKDRKSTTIIVGVVDSGVDVYHEDLKGKIWVNSKEIEGNGKDDDGNGFIDDIYGWDFLGNSAGEDIDAEQLENVRIFNTLKRKFGENPKKRKIKKNREEYDLMIQLEEEIRNDRLEAEMNLSQYKNIVNSLEEAEELLKKVAETDQLSDEIVKEIPAGKLDRQGRVARQMWLQMNTFGGLPALREGVEYFESKLNHHLNPDFEPRGLVGDNIEKLEYGKYGNNEVVGPDARHGTHVSGIIAADRNNELGVKGVADNALIMVLRAVPDGDERDKDIANAIRYAVDNGARVINMSFGKGYSPDKKWIDDAVAYADSKGVLMVAAAGNDGKDIDVEPEFPSRIDLKGNEFKNWINVGALSYKEGADMVAGFSNYGKETVDVFAPGVAVYSTVPDSKYEELDGTSMASPVVAGLATLLFSYFPELTHYEVKDIILKSAVKISDQKVKVNNGQKTLEFSELCTTGGVVNTYEAVKMAIELTNSK